MRLFGTTAPPATAQSDRDRERAAKLLAKADEADAAELRRTQRVEAVQTITADFLYPAETNLTQLLEDESNYQALTKEFSTIAEKLEHAMQLHAAAQTKVRSAVKTEGYDDVIALVRNASEIRDTHAALLEYENSITAQMEVLHSATREADIANLQAETSQYRALIADPELALQHLERLAQVDADRHQTMLDHDMRFVMRGMNQYSPAQAERADKQEQYKQDILWALQQQKEADIRAHDMYGTDAEVEHRRLRANG